MLKVTSEETNEAALIIYMTPVCAVKSSLRFVRLEMTIILYTIWGYLN